MDVIAREVATLYSLLNNTKILPSEIMLVKERIASFISLIHLGAQQAKVKKCSCGNQFSIEDWFSLPLVGYQTSPMAGGEMRNCECGSTLLFLGRRAALKTPKSKLLQGTILDCTTLKLTAPMDSLSDSLNVTEAYMGMKESIFFDEWTDKQLEQAAKNGQPPKWDKDRYGNLIPSYT